MPFLSPAKVLVILVVALIVLGPEKLPRVARQIGELWRDFRTFRERLESEVRDSFPQLPSSDTIAQAVRSPLTFLDNLADSHGTETEPSAPGADRSEPVERHGAHVAPGVVLTDAGGIVHQVRSNGGIVPDDPGMN